MDHPRSNWVGLAVITCWSRVTVSSRAVIACWTDLHVVVIMLKDVEKIESVGEVCSVVL